MRKHRLLTALGCGHRAVARRQAIPFLFSGDPIATFTPTPGATPTPPSVTPDLFTARGIVWHDHDGDGKREAGELGLKALKWKTARMRTRMVSWIRLILSP